MNKTHPWAGQTKQYYIVMPTKITVGIYFLAQYLFDNGKIQRFKERLKKINYSNLICNIFGTLKNYANQSTKFFAIFEKESHTARY